MELIELFLRYIIDGLLFVDGYLHAHQIVTGILLGAAIALLTAGPMLFWLTWQVYITYPERIAASGYPLPPMANIRLMRRLRRQRLRRGRREARKAHKLQTVAATTIEEPTAEFAYGEIVEDEDNTVRDMHPTTAVRQPHQGLHKRPRRFAFLTRAAA